MLRDILVRFDLADWLDGNPDRRRSITAAELEEIVRQSIRASRDTPTAFLRAAVDTLVHKDAHDVEALQIVEAWLRS